MMEPRSLHSGGTVCIVEAWSALQIWEARVCIAEAHGVRGFPPSHHTVHTSSFHVPGRISASGGQAVQYKYRLYEAKRDCTRNELSLSS